MLFQQAVSIVYEKRKGYMRNWLWEREGDVQFEMRKGWMLSALHEGRFWTITRDCDGNRKKKQCITWRKDIVCFKANLVTMCCNCEWRRIVDSYTSN